MKQGLKYDSVDSVHSKINLLRKGDASRKLRNVEFRKEQLRILRAAFVKYENEITNSNDIDLGQKKFMAWLNTFAIVKNELDEILSHIDTWTAPRSVDTPILLAPAKSYVIPEPFGVCLIMSAWNTQFLTLIMPLAQAISAGNCVLAKPSELAEDSAIICEKILAELDPEIVQISQGGAEICIELLKNKFDFIIFTGSQQKGVLVAKAAAEFLTPCILELGGQNPVVVDASADLESTAYNLINGRYLLAGQACIAPEYVMIERPIYEKLLNQLKSTIITFYGDNPKLSPDFSRIINDFHSQRLSKLIKDVAGKGTLVAGGDFDLKEKYISPTIIGFQSLDELSKTLACGEIFGPILFLSPYDKLDECIDFINKREKPLTMYYFGNNSENKNRLLNNTSSGAFVTNDCVVHFANSSLPFGGIGTSGYGAYHGKWGFDNLSHLKPVMERYQRPLLKLRYPPYTNFTENTFKFLMGKCNYTQFNFVKMMGLLILAMSLIYFRHNIIDKFTKI